MAQSETIRCPTWHSPLIRVVPGGLEITCKSCRGAVHAVSRDDLERIWSELAQAKTPEEQDFAPLVCATLLQSTGA